MDSEQSQTNGAATTLRGNECRFFFNQSKQHLTKRFKSLFNPPRTGIPNAGGVQLWKKYGWSTAIERIAESKLFLMEGFTAMDSAQMAECYEIFDWLALQNDKSFYLSNG